jgi:hypothetical protein
MDILTQLTASLFQQNELRFTPIIPIQDFVDLEIGNINEELSKYNLEIKTDRLDNPDLELGFGPIIETSNNHIIIRIQTTNSNNAIVDKYYSLFDSLTYISMSFKPIKV